MIGFPSVYPRHHGASLCIKFVAFRLEHHRKSISWAGVFDFKNIKSTKRKTSKHCSFSFKGLVFLTFFVLLFFFSAFKKIEVFFMMLLFFL